MSKDEIVRVLLAFLKMPGVDHVELSMEGKRFVINLPPYKGTARYSFCADGRGIAAVIAEPHLQITDLKTPLLKKRRESSKLPWCRSLRFWEVEFLTGEAIGNYRGCTFSVTNHSSSFSQFFCDLVLLLTEPNKRSTKIFDDDHEVKSRVMIEVYQMNCLVNSMSPMKNNLYHFCN
jgi:hypothetical protein